jgi:hypothetical protein
MTSVLITETTAEELSEKETSRIFRTLFYGVSQQYRTVARAVLAEAEIMSNGLSEAGTLIYAILEDSPYMKTDDIRSLTGCAPKTICIYRKRFLAERGFKPCKKGPPVGFKHKPKVESV